jgi:4-amino-4-deoxy-L-arabinose transferase-like glycosyltransferase
MRIRYNPWTLLLLILCIGVLFRVWNLETIPSWDYDEGVNINIAWNLAHLRLLWFNLEYTFVPHPPLFFLISGALLSIFGNDLLVLRALTALYGVLTIVLLYLLGRDFLNEKVGLLMSFLFAVYPNAVYFSRIGFANNQFAFLSVLTIYLILKYLKSGGVKWLYMGSITVGLASITESFGIFTVLSTFLLGIIYYRKDLLKSTLIAIIPLGMFFFTMLLVSKDSFIHDVFFQFERLRTIEKVTMDPFVNILGIFLLVFFIVLCYGSRKKISGAYRNVAFFIASCFCGDLSPEKTVHWLRDNAILILFSLNLYAATALDSPITRQTMLNGIPDYFLFGFIGLFLINDRKIRDPLLLFLAPQIFVTAKIGRSDHMLIPLYPYFAIGLAVIIWKIYDDMRSSEKLKILSIPVILVLASPFAVILYKDFSAFVMGVGIDTENPLDRIQVADYVNSNTNATDIVISNVHTARFIKAQASEYAIAYVSENKKFAYMDYTLGPERFLFNASPRNAKFFIADEDLDTLKKTEKYSNLVDILSDIENWSRVKIGRNYVYRNPRMS